MKLALVPILVAGALLASCGSSPERACDPALERGLRAWARAGFSGSIAVMTDGRPDCTAAYGMADLAAGGANRPTTVFSIGSITKAFTAAAVLDLADHGRLALTDRAGALLPTLRGPASSATVRQLLLHTSGLKGSHGEDHRPLSKRSAIAAIGRLRRVRGGHFLYSNAGYTLLALIVEQVSGTSYRDYVATHILRGGGFWDGQPAAPRPRAVGYLEDGRPGHRGGFRGPHWAIDGNGGLAMTMPELASWAHALFSGDVIQSVAQLLTPGVHAGNNTSETAGWVRYDSAVFGQPVYATAGGGGDVGHNAIVVWLPRSKRTIAVASNTARISAEQLLEAIGPALAAGKPVPRPRTRGAEVQAATLRRYAGTYGPFGVAVRGRGLTVTAGSARAVGVLLPAPAGAGVAGHERRVRSLIAGAGTDGAKERSALETSVGTILRVRVDGTVLHDGELRTYVTVTGSRTSMRLWYALNEQGAISAAEGPTQAPTAPLVAEGGGRFRLDDPTGAGPPVTVRFGSGRLTVSGPAGELSARRR